EDADRVAATDVTVRHDAAGDRAELARAEHFADLGRPDDLLLDLRREHARKLLAHVVDRFVDDAVVTHIDAHLLDGRARRAVGAWFEADDVRSRRRGGGDTGSGNTADTARDDFDADFLVAELRERIAQRFRAALHVRLDDEMHGRGFAFAGRRDDVLELRRAALLRELGVAELALAIERDFARLALAFRDEQLVTGVRRAGETEHDDRQRRAGFFDLLSGLVEECTHSAEFVARDDRIARLQGAALHEHRGNRTAAFFYGRFDDDAGRETVAWRLELEHVRLQ